MIDVNFLLCFGLLHCEGKTNEKAEVFYGIIEEGGAEKYDFIAALNKDFEITLKKLAMLSTVHLFYFCRHYNDMDVPFDLTALRASIEDEDNFYEVVDDFLDPIFGAASVLTYQEWSKKLEDEKTTHFVFDAKKFREVIFKKAKLQPLK